MASEKLVSVEMVADAETYSSEKAQDVIQIETPIWNSSKGRVHLIDSHFWHGRTLTNYPALPVGYGAYTRQQGSRSDGGVKFGLVYADGDDTTARKFVVAFDTPAGKAYAEAGPIGPVDWNVVEVKLGTCGRETEYVDPALGGKVIAKMRGDTDNPTATFYN